MSKEIIDYTLVEATYGPGWAKHFSARVRELIEDGWQPYGSPMPDTCGDSRDISTLPLQAMVRYAPE